MSAPPGRGADTRDACISLGQVREIDRQATAVLSGVPAWIWDGERLPVPVEDIADSCFGLLVRDVEDLATAPGAPDLGPGHALSGLLLAARGEIWVNADEARRWPPRRRFTIGHELGHWVMHRTGQQALFCRSATVEAGDGGAQPETVRPPLPVTEEEANAFAAALLMPEHLVRERCGGAGPDLPALCAAFDASKAAMARRLAALGLADAP